MSKASKKWKVFLCYAREDQALTDDFFNRFQHYNARDMDILYDRKPTDENMHEVFHRYASECDVAVLLVNARFVNPDNYANKYEVPVLKERRDDGELVLVGIRLSKVHDLEEWNEDGGVYFFSITNNDLPFTRNKNSQSQDFLKQFAAYSQVDDKDLDDYHDRLRKWIKDIIRKKFGDNPSKSPIDLRMTEDTDRILNDMNPTSLIYSLEKKLSNNKAYWDEAGIAPPVARDSYAFWYCLCQADYYEELQEQLCKLTQDDPIKKLTTVFEAIEKRNAVVRKLLDSECADDNQLSSHLSQVDDALVESMEKVISAPRKNNVEARSILIDALEQLKKELKEIGGSSLGGS